MVDLQSDAFGIAEGEGVVAGRPRAFLGRTHDVGAELAQKRVQRVDVLAPSRPEAQMVDPGGGFQVLHVDVLGVRAANPERRAAADVIDEVLGAHGDGSQAEKRHQLVIEGDALGDAIDPEDHVCDAVHFHSAGEVRHARQLIRRRDPRLRAHPIERPRARR